MAFLIMAWLSCQVATAVDLQDLHISDDTNVPAARRCDALLSLLQKEITDPTQPHQGFGGTIDHDYTMAQLITALSLLLQNNPEIGKQLEDRLGILQSNSEMSDTVEIALAQNGRPKIRDRQFVDV